MATLEELDQWSARFREKFAPFEVRTEDREQVIAEGEVGKWPGDNPDQFLKSGREDFKKLSTERLALSGQVKKARQKEKELHPHPKLERFFDKTIGKVPSFLSPDVKPDEEIGLTPETAFKPTPSKSSKVPKVPISGIKPNSTTGSRFQVEDGEIIDTKNREIISPDQFNRLSTPQERDEIERQLTSGGHMADVQDKGAQGKYGLRQDGTPKGQGFFGELPSKDPKYPPGTVSTELSAEMDVDGKRIHFPLLSPGLTRAEVDSLLAGERPTDAIYNKALAHAQKRIAAGKSPFAEPGERAPLPTGETSPTAQPVDLVLPEITVRPTDQPAPVNPLMPVEPTQPKPRSFSESLTLATNNYFQGLAQVPSGALKSIAIASKELDDLMPEMLKDPRKVEDRFTYKLGASIDRLAKRMFPSDPASQKEFVIGVLPQALGNMTGFMAGGVAGMAAKAPGTAAAVLGAGVGGSSQYEEAKEFKADEPTQRKAFWLGSAVGSTEAIPISLLLNRFNKATGGRFFTALKQTGVTAAQEAAQEWAQQVGSNEIAIRLYDENRSLFENAGVSAEAGGATGAIVGLVTGIIQGRKTRKIEQNKASASSEAPFVGEPAPKPAVPLQPDPVSALPENLTVAQGQQPFLIKKPALPSQLQVSPAQALTNPTVTEQPLPPAPELEPLPSATAQPERDMAPTPEAAPLPPELVPNAQEIAQIHQEVAPVAQSPIDPGPALETIDRMYRTILDDTKATHHMKREQKDAWQVVKRVDQIMKAGLKEGLEYEQAVQRVDPADLQALAQIMRQPKAQAGPTPVEAVRSNLDELDIPSTKGVQGPSVDEIHQLAERNGMAWDNDQAFMDLTEQATGKRHLDHLTGPERQRVAEAINAAKPQIGTDEEFDQYMVRAKKFMAETSLPDYAKQAILNQERSDRTNRKTDSRLSDAEWETSTIPVESIKKKNPELWGKSFQHRGSISKGPIVLDREGQIIDGNNRTFEAIQRGDKTIEAFRPSSLETKANEANTAPTEGQREAGNYRKGHVRIAGLDISIENPQGSTRTGTSKDGKPWSQEMQSHYGYIRGTTGKDKDHLDVFVKPGTPEDYDGTVYVIDQNNEKGRLDEHKVILGAESSQEAKRMYMENYPKNWKGYGAMRLLSMDAFKKWSANATATQNSVMSYNAPKEDGPLTGEVPEPIAPVPHEASTPAYTVTSAELVPTRGPDGKVKWVSKNVTEERYPAKVETKQPTPEPPAAPVPHDPMVGPLQPGELSFEEFLQKTRFYRSGKSKNAEVPGGQKVILKQESTATNFRETSRNFLRGVYGNYIAKSRRDARKPTPEPGISPDDAIVSKIEVKASPPPTPEEAPIFSKAAQEKDAEQTELPATPEEAVKPKSPDYNTGDKVTYRPMLGGKDLPIQATVTRVWRDSHGDEHVQLDSGHKVEAASDRLKKSTVAAETPATPDTIEYTVQSLRPGATPETLTLPKEPKQSDAAKALLSGREGKLPAKADTEEDWSEDGSNKVASFIARRLHQGGTITLTDVTARADDSFGGTQAEGKYTPKDVHDAIEMGINKYLLEYGSSFDPRYKPEVTMRNLRELLDRIPSQQNRRTEEQEEFQQFSTPPDLAYAMNWVANLSPSDTVLEPSAGLGGLAVFAKNAGARVLMNEYSERRANLLRTLKIGEVSTEDATQLHNILPKDVKPTVVIMNPPFSSTAGRMQGERKTANVFPHLEQALKRLEPGGRLVALIGKGKVYKDPQVLEDWITKTATQYAYRARIGLSGEGYKKYGTTYDNQILIFDKIAPDGQAPVIATVNDVVDAIPLLKEVRDARRYTEEADTGTAPHELRSTQSAREKVPTPGETDAGPRQPVPDPVSAVGTRQDQAEKSAVAERPAAVVGQSSDMGAGTRTDVSPRQSRRSAKSTAPQAPVTQSDVGETSGQGGAERAGSADERGPRRGLSTDEVPNRVDLDTEKSARAKSDDLTDSVYESYSPRKAKIAGSKKHPGKLVESAALGAVDPPDATYRPHLPKSVIDKGVLSDAQLESVVYAGQAHEQMLPSGERRGFFLGDGPGVGKGRQIAAMILDNWQQGRKKTVWLSETQNLVNSAVRDWEALGGKASDITGLNKFTRDQKIERPTGILYTTYTTMASGLDVLAGGGLKAKSVKGDSTKSVKTRLDQVIDWLGADFDGIIVFDEAHNMANSLEQEGERGDTKPAAKALASVTLQNRLPKARIVYASATAATKVDGLAYAERLGLWGEGTSFPKKTDFINAIESSGLGAMEIVAQNMKTHGAYMSRSLDYSDVRTHRLEHQLTDSQREIYNELANAWGLVLNNVEAALELTGVAAEGKKSNAAAKSAAYSKFWGANQRFFNQILTSMQMPSVIKDMKARLDKGQSLLFQLVNTNEAIMDRQLHAAEQSGADLESLDMTPRQNLMQYIEKGFPTAQFEEYEDENGNKRTRMVTDSKGVPVQNAEAVKMRDDLLEKLGAVRVPEGPLEILINTFGTDMVAEVTGRSERVVRIKNEDDGTETVQRQKRSPASVREDVTAYMDGKKRILVFSDKGGTGESYHADKTKKNQQQRAHYLGQPGWRADKAVQGLGRSHRTNQASAPEWILVTTDIKGHKRFISTIARRLNQLGALTKGQRQAGSSGLIDAKDNLENEYATGSIKGFFRDLFRNQAPGFSFADVTKRLGLHNLVDKDGQLIEERIPTVPQFLNRILSVELDYQNKLFDEFTTRLDRAVDFAAQQGTLDVGMETYRADGGITVLDRATVHEDPSTKAKVELIHLEAKHANKLLTTELVEKKDFTGYVQNNNTGKIWAQMYELNRTKDDGSVAKMTLLRSPIADKYQYVETSDLKRLYTSMDKSAGRKAWDKQMDAEPTHSTERFYMANGSILSIWDRLPKDHAKIRRLQTTDGERYLGRILTETQAGNLKVKLGKGQKSIPTLTPAQSFEAVLEEGDTLKLANDWQIKRVRVNNEPRIEVVGEDVYRSADQLKGYGAFSERIQFATRYFIPTEQTAGERVLEKILKFKPIVDIIKKGMAILKEERGSVPVSTAKGYAGEAERYRTQRAKEDLIGFQSADHEIEARVREAKRGVQPESLYGRLKDHGARVWKLVSREFEHLPDTAEFSRLRNDLLRLQKYKGIAADKIQRDLASIIKPLSRKQYDQLEWKALLSDLVREAEQGHALPFGYTPEKVETDLARLDEVIARDPKVAEAWTKRQALWDRLKTDYKSSMESIGFDVSKKLTKQDYFRHQVLEHAKQRAVSGTGAKVRTPTGRGFLKTRKGSTYDINANYVQAEFEVMAQMVYDTQLAKVIKGVDQTLNIRKSLEQEAKTLNREALAQMVEHPEHGPIVESQLKDFKKRIGMHMSMLKRALEMEKDDELSMAQIADIADDLESPGRLSALGVLKAISERKAYTKDLLGNQYMTWDRLIPETHDLWQPREGNVFYLADSIPAHLVKALQESMLEESGFPVEKLRKVLAQGGAREEYVIPKEAKDTLDNLSKPAPNWFVEMNRQLLGHWKQLMLIAPRRVIRYNVRNLTGDADALFVGNPSAFKLVPQAAKDLLPVIFKDEQLTGEAKQWAERGGYGTTLQFQELGDLNDLKAFQKTLDQASKGGLLSLPAKVWNGYWKAARLSTDYREAMFRYAAYLDYLHQMQANNGRPKNFGASRPETVMALPDVRDRAFKLSNELLGAYDRVSVAGQTIRAFWEPFYSWMEVNATRYFRLVKNALDSGNGGQLAKGALVTSRQAAGFLIRLSAFWSMLQAWNYMMFPDDEDELRDANPTVANKPHILFGRDDEGKIQYLSGVGALGDLLSWFGLDAFPGMIGDIQHGRTTIGEAIKNAAKAPVNKLWQGLTPVVKTPLELAVRESTYPDVFNPRPIQDRGDYLGNQVTLGPELRALRDKPGKPLYGSEDLSGLLVQRSDPKSAAYGTWNSIEKKYLERMGKDSSAVFWRSPRGEALSNWSRAIADKDAEAQATWQAEYERMERDKYGSKFTKAKMWSDIERSLRAKAPLAGVTKAERASILSQLDEKETRALHKAEQYYRDVIMQVLPPSRRYGFEHRLEQQGWLMHDPGMTPETLHDLVP